MKNLYPIILLLLLSITANAQFDNSTKTQNQQTDSKSSENIDTKESIELKNFLSLKLGATDPFLGVSYERLFSSNVGAEVTVGLIGISIGPKFYLPSIRPEKVNFHTGLILGWGYFAQGAYGYLPIGINKLTKNNLILSLDLGPQFLFGDAIIPGGMFEIGKAF